MFAHDVSFAPGTSAPAVGFCFPPPIMAGHIVQHLVECEARALSLLPDVKAYWFPLVQLAAVRSIEVAAVAEKGCFQWPSPDGGLKNWRYPRWRMISYALDCRTKR